MDTQLGADLKNRLFQFKRDGQKISAQVLGQQLWLHVHGQTFCVEYQKKTKKYGAKAAEAKDQLLAPMPGRVTKVLGAPNDKVKKGATVVVMEAMKMEYTLKAGFDAEIETINCQEGEQVPLGKVLVKFKPQKPAEG